MVIDRFGPYGFIAFLLIFSLLPSAAGRSEIIPVRTRARFSAQDRGGRWSVPIKTTDGSIAYILSLEPDFDLGHHVVTLELVLRRAGTKLDAANLFDPTGKRHGLQAYDFAADDLAHGAQNSAFGEKRTVDLKNLGLIVRIDVSKATVSPLSPGNYQLNALELQIEVDNLNP
ncbi:MAG TPA: hypothetical protein VMH00_14770 [Candidatus Limnocylindrales bacterium]|nr:hypothetical protein [Candidatus Limnocylindrales bacterium]